MRVLFKRLKHNNNELKKDVAQIQVLFSRHENMFTQLIFPMLDDLLSFIAGENLDKKGNTLDADLRRRFDRYRKQVKYFNVRHNEPLSLSFLFLIDLFFYSM